MNLHKEDHTDKEDDDGAAYFVDLVVSNKWLEEHQGIRIMKGQKYSKTLTARDHKGGNGIAYVILNKKTGELKSNQDYASTLTVGAHGHGNHSDMDMIGLTEESENGMFFQVRRFTPVECERLQGYPDGWTEGVSNSQRFKSLGNSITVNVAEGVLKKMFSDYIVE